ncbi:alpha/beta fold hydrolase [Microvirga sp. VF16]|uniref:alpha/beta fold hydrolase n=1 Tax=Microvirga sp. VF16 TaxID=2807101 RepID=UPI00193E9BEC|nr:alpha/beta hydrolase [Microvirga sp. VF16]QRM30366.1 alpha/beta hydrolase [Microvirga sp. VF16]
MSESALHLEDQGGGSPALIFLHYFAGSLRSWVHVAGELSSSSRCLCIDLPGFGRSAPLPAYSVHSVAQAVAQFIGELRLENYVLVGHSMGGKLALACAAANPLELAGLVLVAPSPPSPEPMDEKERTRLLATHGDRTSAERTIRTITRRPILAEDVAICIEDNLLTSPEAWRWWLAQGSREDITAQAKRVACPVLVLGGSDDPVIPPRVIAADVMSRLVDATHIEIAGAGHLLPLEAAQEVEMAIRSFVARRCLRTGSGPPRL